VVDTLARGFLAHGHEVVLFTTGDSTCPVDRRFIRDETDTARMNQSMPEIAHVLSAYETLHDCDVVHDHTTVGPLLGPRIGAPPVVTTMHNPFDAEACLVYEVISRQAAVITVSHSQRAAAHGVCIERTIHHGVEASRFPVGDGKGDYLLFLGRLAPEKGAHRAIEVASLAGMTVKLAGKMHSPEEHRYFDECVRPHLGRHADYLGEVDHDEKLRLLGDATALLNPIRWREPFGLVMIEALACGTPVLAFCEGAAVEIVQPGLTGFLCTNEHDMAAAVTHVRQLDRRNCRAAVTDYFSAERMVREHIMLFDHIVSSAFDGDL
jgi:glycosyltransferase involved in cell wall biosynthesis